MTSLPGWDLDQIGEKGEAAEAAALAEALLVRSEALITGAERRRRTRLAALLGSEAGRELLFVLTDEVLRSPDAARATGRLRRLLSATGLNGAGPLDRAALRAAGAVSHLTPRLVRRAVRARFLREVKGVVSVGRRAMQADLDKAAREGFQVNVNLLGEAIVGDEEADRHLKEVCALLRRADVACISAKVTSLCANLDPLAFDDSVERIASRVREILRVAQEAQPTKFVYLDMEDFEDLELTAAAFTTVLSEDEFHLLPAGLALQAYLPDSHRVLEDICRFAEQRRRAGGAWLRVRLVKGANLAMETARAEIASWPSAPYATKAEVDASFKRMLDVAIGAGAKGDLRVAVASHNLFDIAWALVQRERRGVADRVSIEMLNGMAPAQARAVREVAGDLLLYAPVTLAEDFSSSIAYLSRRLDENAGSENFLRALFSITPGSGTWRQQLRLFVEAVQARATVSVAPNRTQDRSTPSLPFSASAAFANVPDTDFSRAVNRTWALGCLSDAQPTGSPALITDRAGIDDVVQTARGGAAQWSSLPRDQREALLARAASDMSANRRQTLGVMAHETGKTLREGDPEVSEAIDMARWAIECSRVLTELEDDGVRCDPVGVVVVAGPWNFPYAIPANGVCSALAAGNAVILKPAPEAVDTAAELVRQLHRAGIPPDAVQLARCPDDEVGRHLICHDDVGTVVLTGAFETATMFHRWKPSLRLLAETSGKNAMVITASADIDLAVADLVRSSFGHAGQKCSAASLAIIDAELYDKTRFLERLTDAVRSLRIGPASDPSTMMGPLIHPPHGALLRALTVLDPGEAWLAEPRQLGAEGRLWTPGVKVGVQPGSWFHQTECFGPVLGVMRARNLDHALELQNAVAFGLTGGLQSLDPAEVDYWLERVEVGNAYVNRHTTGAIVRRQPFGGWKHSSVGPTAKAGGPDYLLRFVRPRPAGPLPKVAEARTSYLLWWDRLYGRARDATGLRAEANTLRHFPLRSVLVRVGRRTTDHEVDLLRMAAGLGGAEFELSAPQGSAIPGAVVEDEPALAARIGASGAVRLRHLEPVGDALRTACHEHSIVVDETPVTGHGRIELPCWLREQAISRTLHRHGRFPPKV